MDVEKALRMYAERAESELRKAGEWDAYEERVSLYLDYEPKVNETRPLGVRAIILFVLRGESPEAIPICIAVPPEVKKSIARHYIDEIKGQLKTYFGS